MSDDFRMLDHVGKAGIFKVRGPKQVETKFGLKTAVQADVVILDGRGAKEFTDVLIFAPLPAHQLNGCAGQRVVAMIDEFKSKAGNMAPKLGEPTDADVEAAERYLEDRA